LLPAALAVFFASLTFGVDAIGLLLIAGRAPLQQFIERNAAAASHDASTTSHVHWPAIEVGRRALHVRATPVQADARIVDVGRATVKEARVNVHFDPMTLESPCGFTVFW
jgi:hypothetical protein